MQAWRGRIVLNSAIGILTAALSWAAIAADAPRITNISIAANSTLSTAPSSVTVTFSEAMDPATLTAQKFQLKGRGTDGVFNTADDTVIPISQVSTASNTATFTFGTTVPDDVYQLTLRGTDAGKALQFDGVNDFCTALKWLSGTGNAGTVECWAKATHEGSGDIILHKATWNDLNFGWTKQAGQDAKINLNFPLDHGGDYVSPDLAIGTWYHLAGVYDGSAVRLYVNGVEKLNVPFSGSIDWDNGYTNSYIGGMDDPWGGNFPGILDEIRVWNIARSQSEIQAFMHTPLAGTETGLCAYYHFNEGAGLTTADSSPNARTATLGGSAVAADTDPVWVDSTAPIWGGIRSAAGKALDGEFSGALPSGDGNEGADFVVNFTVDSTAPQVVSSAPANGAINVSCSSAIEFVFSEAMNTASVQSALMITPNFAKTFAWTGNTLKVTPTSGFLSGNTLYSVALSTAAKDAGGAALDTARSFSFTTDYLTLGTVTPASGPIGSTVTDLKLTGTRFKQGSGIYMPPGATVYNGHGYVYVSAAKNWQQAKAYCESLNGHLITFADAAENSFAASIIPANTDTWIGMSDVAVEGQWKFVTGETATYFAWAGSEPNGATQENFAERYSSGQWNDNNGTILHGFVCEFESLAAPSIRLKKNAEIVNASNVRFISSTELRFDVDLTSATAGFWDVEVTNPDGTATSTLAGAFEVQNSPPVAVNDAYTVLSNGTLNVPAPGVLANDSDVNGQTLVAQIVTSPALGNLTLNMDGSFNYVTPANFTGTQSFVYSVSDGIASVQATVSIEISRKWNLVIPLQGSTYVASPYQTPVIAAASFSNARATIHKMELTYRDQLGNVGRNYDAFGYLHNAANISFKAGDGSPDAYTAYVGAFQIGRYNDIYPSVMTFYVRKDFDADTFDLSTPGQSTVLDSANNGPIDVSGGVLYARAWTNRGDGNTSPSVDQIKLLTEISCPTMPGAYIRCAYRTPNGCVVRWRPSPATQASTQKLYRAASAAGPWTLIQSFSENTTAAFTDINAGAASVYYKVVAAQSDGTAGSDSNLVSDGGQFGLQFSTDDTVKLPTELASYAHPVTGFTWECWTRFSAGAPDNNVLSAQNFVLGTNNRGDGNKRFVFQVPDANNGPANTVYFEPQGGVQNARWYHIAGVADYPGHQIRLYIDGQLANQAALNVNPVLDSLPFQMGPLNGTIDQVRVWGAPRNLADIQSTMFSRLTGSETGLIAYYDFDEGSGQLAHDLTANARDGVLGSTLAVQSTDPVWVSSQLPTFTLVTTPASFSFAARQGMGNPTDQTLQVSKLGSQSVPFTITTSQPWLQVTPTSGTLGTTSMAMTVHANATGLPLGDSSANIVITTASDTFTLPVSIRISGLLAWWKLDEGTGTTAADSSGNGNTATLLNGPVWTNGVIGGALGFDGPADQLRIPDDIVPAHNGTVALWFKTSSSGVILSTQNTVYPNTPTVYQPVLFVGTDGKLHGQFWDGSSDPIVTSNVVNNGQWHLATILSDGSSQKLYCDGVLAGSHALTISDIVTPKQQFGLGYTSAWSYTNGTWFPFVGALDDIRLFNYPLSEVEIGALLPPTAPSVAPDTYITTTDHPLTVAAPGVLGNDYDLNHDPFTAMKVGNPSHGVVNLNANGSFTYTPSAGYSGLDSFTYKASDGTLESAAVTVTIQVGDVTGGLVLHWKLDESSGTIAADSSGQNNPGTLVGGSVWLPAGGVLQGALQFDGADDAVQAPASASLEPANGLTVSTWAYITNTNGSAVADLVRKELPLSDGFALRWNNSAGHMEWWVLRGGSPLQITDSQANSAYLNAWHLFTCTFDAASGTSQFFVDGVQRGTASGTPGVLSHTGNFAVMKCENSAAIPGVLDDVRIFDRALTTLEIQALANKPPVASADSYAFAVNATLNVAAPGVLANDTDPENDALVAELVTPPELGAFTLNPSGAFTFTPPADYAGFPQAFTYRARDIQGRTSAPTTVMLNAPAPTLTGVTPAVALRGGVVSLSVTGTNLPTGTYASSPQSTVRLDGINDYFTVPNSARLNSPNITIETWLYCTKPGPIYVKRNGRPNNWEQTNLQIDSNGHVWLQMSSAGGTQVTMTGVSDVRNKWAHIAVSYDGSIARIYVNGQLEKQQTLGFPIATANEEAKIGYDAWWTGGYLGGVLNEFRIWNVARSQSEIQTTLNDTLTSAPASLILRYDFAGGPNLVDTTGNGQTSFSSNDPQFGSERNTARATVRLMNGPNAATISTLTSSLVQMSGPVATAALPVGVYNVQLLLDGQVVATLPNAFTLTDLILQAPSAADSVLNVTEDIVANGAVNATDPNGDPLTFAIVNLPTKGTVALNQTTGAYTYTPNANANGSDHFTFVASDGVYASNLGTVLVEIAAVNDAPIAVINADSTNGVPLGVATVLDGSASTDDQGALTIFQWDFGDGTTTTTATPTTTHAWTTPGIYTVTLTVVDDGGLKSSASIKIVVAILGGGASAGTMDSDGDGFSDELELAMNTNPLNAFSTPMKDQPLGKIEALTDTKLRIALNLSRPDKDTLQLSGSLPISAGFAPLGQQVIVDIGGVIKAFTLSAKGMSPTGSAQLFKLQFKQKKGVVAAQTGKFSVAFKSGDFSEELSTELNVGKVQKKAKGVVVATVIFNGNYYERMIDVTITGTAKRVKAH